ncbi:MAG TPA: tetratricopeptide repeat protein, partial [Phormidium sp.]
RYEIGDYQGAIEDYTEAMRLATEKNSDFISSMYYRRGQARVGLGDIQGAIEDYTEAIRLEPDDYLAYQERAIAFSSIGHYQESIEDWTHLLKTSEDGLIYYFRGLTRFRWGDKQGAIEDLEKSTKDILNFKRSFPEIYQKVQDRLRELQE